MIKWSLDLDFVRCQHSLKSDKTILISLGFLKRAASERGMMSFWIANFQVTENFLPSF